MATPKRMEFHVSVDHDGKLLAEQVDVLETGEAWTPEHLVLAALGRCIGASLEYHANRASFRSTCAATADGVVTKREDDGRYAFVELSVSVEAELEPAPAEADLRELLEKAERDCFVSASLRATPRYAWRVNGRDVD